MLSNFTGSHLLIVLAVLLIFLVLIAAAVAIVVAIVRRSSRVKQVTPGGRPAADGDPSARLAQLDELRHRNQITDAEYDARRRAIVDRL